MSQLIARGGGAEIPLDELLLALRVGEGKELLEKLLTNRLSSIRAKEDDVELSPDEKSSALADYLAERDLVTDEATDAWLKDRLLSRGDIERWVLAGALRDKLKGHLVPDDAVLRRFEATSGDHSRIEVEEIRFESVGAADEIALELREGEIPWTTASARAGGMTPRSFTRPEVPEAALGPLMAAGAGEIVGPIEADDGRYALYRFLRSTEPVLDDALREEIRRKVFREIIERSLADRPFRFVE